MDPEPGRFRSTDANNWGLVVGQNYFERHMHSGRNSSRKHVEIRQYGMPWTPLFSWFPFNPEGNTSYNAAPTTNLAFGIVLTTNHQLVPSTQHEFYMTCPCASTSFFGCPPFSSLVTWFPLTRLQLYHQLLKTLLCCSHCSPVEYLTCNVTMEGGFCHKHVWRKAQSICIDGTQPERESQA